MIRLARRQDTQAIARILEQLICRIGLERAMDSVMFPLLRGRGDLWHQDGMSLRGEQSVSGLVRQHLINVLREEPPMGGPSALIACVPGDFHEILRGIGWHSIYLVPNVSFEMLARELRRKHAQLIFLACNLEPEEKTLRSWLKDTTRLLQPTCTVMVGGPGFAPYSHLFSLHNISFFNRVRDVKNFKPRLRNPDSERTEGRSSFIP